MRILLFLAMAYFHAKLSRERFAVVVHADSAWVMPLTSRRCTASFYLLKILELARVIKRLPSPIFRDCQKVAIDSQFLKGNLLEKERIEEIKCIFGTAGAYFELKFLNRFFIRALNYP